VLIISALVFFFLVVLFILKQRVFDRGLRVALWWTRFLPDFTTGDTQLTKGGDLTTSTTAVVSSTITSTLLAGSPTSLSMLNEPSTSPEAQDSKTLPSLSDSTALSPTVTYGYRLEL
jgi:protein transport protein SEC20